VPYQKQLHSGSLQLPAASADLGLEDEDDGVDERLLRQLRRLRVPHLPAIIALRTRQNSLAITLRGSHSKPTWPICVAHQLTASM
jgi:hypothetical protein